MFSGSASGAGKSNLSAAVADALAGRGQAVRYLSEDDLLARADFGRFERSLGPTDPETHRADLALLDATQALVDGARNASDVLILDALLPGFFWLFGRYDADRVRTTAERMAERLAPLDPLLLYLRGDPATLVARAAVDRGSDWPALMASRVARWNLPHYKGPVRNLDDVLRFWSWLDSQTVDLLATWPVETLVLDAHRPIDELRAAVLTAFSVI
jgi:hypothetical protein